MRARARSAAHARSSWPCCCLVGVLIGMRRLTADRAVRPAGRAAPPSVRGPNDRPGQADPGRSRSMVSVFNGGKRSGLASRTDGRARRARLRRAATVGNAPKGPRSTAPRSGPTARQPGGPAGGAASSRRRQGRREASRPRPRHRRRGRRRSSSSCRRHRSSPWPRSDATLQPAGQLTGQPAQPGASAARPCRATAPAGRSATPGAAAPRWSSRTLRGVTTSRSSPWRRTVRRSGTSDSPVADDQRDRGPVRQPQLADLDAVQPGAGLT